MAETVLLKGARWRGKLLSDMSREDLQEALLLSMLMLCKEREQHTHELDVLTHGWGGS